MGASGRNPQPGQPSILIICPAPPRSRSGNRVRALRYQSIFRQLGFRAHIYDNVHGRHQTTVAINAVKSAQAVAESKSRHPDGPVVVVVTGTDLYRHGDSLAFRETLVAADVIVVSQPTMLEDLPKEFRPKCRVIFQSVNSPARQRTHRPRNRRVLVCGHLRPVKDPLRAARAARGLPKSSQITIEHYGGALQEAMETQARDEMQRNPRYQWHGEVTRGVVRRKLAAAWLMVLSSKMEGGANVLSEALSARTPVLATRISGTTGLLGKGYPGYFEVGKTVELRDLLIRCEDDLDFYDRLSQSIAKRSHLVDREREIAAWQSVFHHFAD